MTVDLAISVLNCRNPDLTIDSQASLEGEMGPSIRAVRVDNHPADGSADKLERAVAEGGWSAWASVLLSPSNGGLPRGATWGFVPWTQRPACS